MEFDLQALADDWSVNAQNHDMVLNALADDWSLNANKDVERSAGTIINSAVYLTDELGNRLTDPLGNYLVALFEESVYPQILHANKDDFELRA